MLYLVPDENNNDSVFESAEGEKLPPRTINIKYVTTRI
ncbi:hypothetical protein ATN83_1333 [Raoultella ornithinolytica]|nr:hypothetical protein ATN83_1333 [Raoultella ornithinolytica]KDV92396.1 hypothetical protein AB00_3557 [Raoultella ornithinolytica 2-156-04_S1_C1]KDX13623.1 hypothetical protein AB28_3563 [Raoultella ornithinolytica 2-156-04_S1_C2]